MDSSESFVKQVTSSKVYDLGQPYFWGMPVHPADPPFLIYLYRYHEHTSKLFEKIAPGLGFADSLELVTTSMHSGTHLDALCHMSRNGKLHGGVNAAELESHVGYTKMSVEEVPIIVKRAVLLDFPAYKGVDILPERYEITPADVEGATEKEGVRINPGDAVLVRTGYSRYLTTDADAYLHKFAGLTAEAARHLASKKISVACSDNLAFGVPKPFELHQVFLVDNGIYMIKSMNLEELARDKVYVSTLIVTPLKIRGATGSLVRPIALCSLG
ncbi:MAG TPA: cyclase family protein [Nitrososphaerales archaeon]|nr:cyclase family protein [Nitrososphaerales archaeon]